MRARPARSLARRLAGLAAISTLVALGLAGTASVHSAAAASTPLPTAVFAKTSDWGTGFSASYTVTNAMSVTMNSWAVSFTLPATEKVT
ncbi:MAG TPA: cellulose binding domain-containing protein, partial [Pseudonocardiaceae bacterium]|nr:cellulose binding domain-containing protein [Pseudonocardiaceae bacterium]